MRLASGQAAYSDKGAWFEFFSSPALLDGELRFKLEEQQLVERLGNESTYYTFTGVNKVGELLVNVETRYSGSRKPWNKGDFPLGGTSSLSCGNGCLLTSKAASSEGVAEFLVRNGR